MIAARPAAAQVDTADQAETEASARHQVTGTVTDASSGSPLPGVNVTVKGTTIGAATDMDGTYTFVAPSPSDTLLFSFLGYETREVPISGRSAIDVALQPAVLQGQQVVVVGYQTQRKADLTGAVSVVDVEDVQDAPTASPIKALQGHVPGVFINTDGSPGGGATVRIRGISTLGNNDPLYVVDGIPTKSGVAQSLNPNTIESIQVLKDAASASIYGARASNGVIIITTQDPEEGTSKITYSSNVTISENFTKLNPLGTIERGRVLWQAAINDDVDPGNLPIYDYEWERRADGTAVLQEVIVPKYVGPRENGILSGNTDWFDEISRTGLIQNHNLSFSTGSERGGAYLSLGYHNNEGVIRQIDYRRISARINSNYNLLDGRPTVGENFKISESWGTPMPSGLGGTPLWLALISQPILPVHTEDGGFAGPSGAGFDDRDNPVRLLMHNRWDQNNDIRAFGNVFAELEVVDNLTFNTRFGIDWVQGNFRDIQRTFQTGFIGRGINSLRRVNSDNFTWTFNSTLDYNLDAGNHSASFLAGVEAVNNEFQISSTYREEFAIEELSYFMEDAGTGKQTVGGSKTGFSLLSYFGKVNYSYADKYLASATLRYDGSSRFGANNKFGIFPAFSVAWRLSNEAFVEDHFGFISDLKLRAAWGKTGNQEIVNSAIYELFVPNYGDDPTWGPSDGTAYDLWGNDTGTLPSGFLRVQRGNDDLKWEEATEINLGVDFGFFGHKLTGSFDYFNRVTTDILVLLPYIAVVGDGGGRWVNGATVNTNGFELALTYQDYAGDFTYSVFGNVGHYEDKITELPAEVVNAYPGNREKTILGRSQTALFGYVVDGIFQNEAEVEAHAVQPGKAVGRLRYADLNGDGYITPLDQKYLGDSTPDYVFGLGAEAGYRNFDLSVFFQGVRGREVYNPRLIYTDFTSHWSGANYGRRTLNAWTPQNRDSRIPALTLTDSNNEDRPSTYFIQDGSYLKLREVKIGYTLPQSLMDALPAVSNASIYVRGANLLTFKDASGDDAFTSPDPENPENAFPIPRNYTFGINLTF